MTTYQATITFTDRKNFLALVEKHLNNKGEEGKLTETNADGRRAMEKAELI